MTDSDDDEIAALLESLSLRYGYDFRGYTKSSMERRMQSLLARSGLRTIAQLHERAVADAAFGREFLSELTVNVTEMFRDPEVYRAIRREVVPVLKTYPSVRIWHAGCSTGEEVYSMAILLKEEGLLHRSFLYGTDISPRAIEKAKTGVYPSEGMQQYESNYRNAGGTGNLGDHFESREGLAAIDPALKDRILFAPHNLVTDEAFSEVHMAFCRNVLIYFTRPLQDRAIRLFQRSLVRRGFLCLGTKESLEFMPMEKEFEAIAKREKIYRLI